MIFAWLMLSLLAAWWLATVVHEGGHLMAGLLVGFRLEYFAAGPLRVVKEAGRVRMRWNRNLMSWGGMVFMIPRDCPKLATRFAWYAAAGPIASLALAVASLSGLVLADWMSRGWWLSLVLLTANSGILLGSLQPFTFGGIPSDGGRVLMYFFDRPKADAWAAAALEYFQAQEGAGAPSLREPSP